MEHRRPELWLCDWLRSCCDLLGLLPEVEVGGDGLVVGERDDGGVVLQEVSQEGEVEPLGPDQPGSLTLEI